MFYEMDAVPKIKKSEEIQKKLMAKSDKLDSRTKNILDFITGIL